MNIKRLGIHTLFVATVAVAIPHTAMADTVTIEAVETAKGKQPTTHRFSVELASDRGTSVEWSDRAVSLDLALMALHPSSTSAKTNDKKDRRFSYKIRAHSNGQRLELESVVRVAEGHRHVIGRVEGKDRSLELAMIVTK